MVSYENDKWMVYCSLSRSLNFQKMLDLIFSSGPLKGTSVTLFILPYLNLFQGKKRFGILMNMGIWCLDLQSI